MGVRVGQSIGIDETNTFQLKFFTIMKIVGVTGFRGLWALKSNFFLGQSIGIDENNTGKLFLGQSIGIDENNTLSVKIFILASKLYEPVLGVLKFLF